MDIINVGDAKTQLSKLIEMALAGEEVVIGKRNHPLVKLMPLIEEQPIKKRVGGHLRGQIMIPDDFDAIDRDIIDAFEGSTL